MIDAEERHRKNIYNITKYNFMDNVKSNGIATRRIDMPSEFLDAEKRIKNIAKHHLIKRKLHIDNPELLSMIDIFNTKYFYFPKNRFDIGVFRNILKEIGYCYNLKYDKDKRIVLRVMEMYRVIFLAINIALLNKREKRHKSVKITYKFLYQLIGMGSNMGKYPKHYRGDVQKYLEIAFAMLRRDKYIYFTDDEWDKLIAADRKSSTVITIKFKTDYFGAMEYKKNQYGSITEYEYNENHICVDMGAAMETLTCDKYSSGYLIYDELDKLQGNECVNKLYKPTTSLNWVGRTKLLGMYFNFIKAICDNCKREWKNVALVPNYKVLNQYAYARGRNIYDEYGNNIKVTTLIEKKRRHMVEYKYLHILKAMGLIYYEYLAKRKNKQMDDIPNEDRDRMWIICTTTNSNIVNELEEFKEYIAEKYINQHKERDKHKQGMKNNALSEWRQYNKINKMIENRIKGNIHTVEADMAIVDSKNERDGESN